MTCLDGITDCRLWWSDKLVNMFEGAPFRLTEYMSGARFELIGGVLRYTDKEVPMGFKDQFHKIRCMADAQGDHYATEYNPAWLNVLNKSIDTFFNSLCPGFMVVPCKPYLFGNKYHTSGGGVHPSGAQLVIWRVLEP